MEHWGKQRQRLRSEALGPMHPGFCGSERLGLFRVQGAGREQGAEGAVRVTSLKCIIFTYHRVLVDVIIT